MCTSMCSLYCWNSLRILLFLIGTFTSTQCIAKGEEWNITAGDPLVKVLPPLGKVIIISRELSASNSTSAVTCQVHSQIHNVTLSLTTTPLINTAVTGRDVGVISLLRFGQTQAFWFLQSSYNFSISVIVAVKELTSQDPLPGGCNIEFNLENDANIHLHYTKYLTVLAFQWAAVSFKRGQQFPLNCVSKSDHNSLTYDIYVKYLRDNDLEESTYLTAIQQLLSSSDTNSYMGDKIHSLTYNDKSNLSVVSHPGQGAIYTIVVRQAGKGSSLYFPVVSYGCPLESQNETRSCQQLLSADISAIILTTVGGIIGLFICFFGHRFFKTEMFIFGFLALALVTYIALLVTTDVDVAVRLGVAGSVGLVGGILWWLFWWSLGIPVLSVLLVGLVAGFLFSSLLFFTPLGALQFWQNDFNYAMTFSCGILLLPVFLLIFTRMLSILSCAFVGSFCALMAADTYLQSNLKYILLTQFYRFSVPGYNKALQTVPFLINEIILSVLWVLVFISGAVFQYIRERKRPPFPPCPRSKRRARALYQRQTQSEVDETQPLLRGDRQHPPNYGRTRVISFPPSSPQTLPHGAGVQ